MIARSQIRIVARLAQRTLTVLALLSVVACSWVDDVGLQEGDEVQPQFDAVNSVLEGEVVPFPLSSLDAQGEISDVSLTFESQGADVASCSAYFSPFEAAESLRAACQPGLSDAQCAVGVEVGDESLLVSLPELRYPVGLRYQLAFLNSAQQVSSTVLELCVQSVSSPPVGVDDSFAVAYGEALQTTATQWGDDCQVLGGTGVLMNDTDDFDYSEVSDDGPACLTAQLIAEPAYASDFGLAEDGSFRYVSNGAVGPGGVDSFQYQVSDGVNASDPVDVQLSIVGENLPPEAFGISVNLLEDNALTVQVAELGADPEGLPLRLSSVNAAGQGDTEIRNGALHYQPPSGFNGTARVFFSLVDMAGVEADGLVAINVQPVNDAPEFVDVPTQLNIEVADPSAPDDVTFTLDVSDEETPGPLLTVTAGIDPALALVAVGSPDDQGRVQVTLSPRDNGDTTLTMIVRDMGFAGLAARSTRVEIDISISGLNTVLPVDVTVNQDQGG